MMNMSYCRFENTRKALDECTEALGEMIDGDPSDGKMPKPLSRTETEQAKALIRSALTLIEMVSEYCAIDEYDALAEHEDAMCDAIDDMNEELDT